MHNIMDTSYLNESNDEIEVLNKLRKIDSVSRAEKEITIKQAKKCIRRRRLKNFAVGAGVVTAGALGVLKYKKDTDQLKDDVNSRDEKLKKAIRIINKQNERMGKMKTGYKQMSSEMDKLDQLKSQLGKVTRSNDLRKTLNKEYINIIRSNMEPGIAKKELERIKNTYKNG